MACVETISPSWSTHGIHDLSCLFMAYTRCHTVLCALLHEALTTSNMFSYSLQVAESATILKRCRVNYYSLQVAESTTVLYKLQTLLFFSSFIINYWSCRIYYSLQVVKSTTVLYKLQNKLLFFTSCRISYCSLQVAESTNILLSPVFNNLYQAANALCCNKMEPFRSQVAFDL